MKRLVATSLLLGYIMLVPFCFFGGMLMVNDSMANMSGGNPSLQMDDCGMPATGCSHSASANGVDSATHHVGMYNSITQTPLVSFSIMLAALVALVLIAFSLAHDWLSVFFSRVTLYPRARRADEPQNNTRQNILRWLSLFETSPNFA